MWLFILLLGILGQLFLSIDNRYIFMFIAAVFTIANTWIFISKLLDKEHAVCIYSVALFGHKEKWNNNIKVNEKMKAIMSSKICKTKKTNIASFISCVPVDGMKVQRGKEEIIG